jgi:uncharacterized protein YndB with AHSA1/START domain
MNHDFNPELDLELVRDLKAPRATLWACWTDEQHLPHWFVPKPHKVVACTLDLRAGGACCTTFDVDGNLMENNGVYLEVIPQEKLVFTDTYQAGWKPAAEPFMTAIITLEDLEPGVTRYRAVVRHRSKEAAEQHRTMGFMTAGGRWRPSLRLTHKTLPRGRSRFPPRSQPTPPRFCAAGATLPCCPHGSGLRGSLV